MHPVSIKGVLFVDGKVALVRNDRNEWELPGGRMDPGETHEQTLVREFREELSIDVEPQDIIDSYVFEVIPLRFVSILTYGCRLRGEFRPALSDEHNAFGLHALGDLEKIPLPAGYARSIRSWSTHSLS
jgi:8-oxo-dGTP pyrophosphatase MutT (NUDIX family)